MSNNFFEQFNLETGTPQGIPLLGSTALNLDYHLLGEQVGDNTDGASLDSTGGDTPSVGTIPSYTPLAGNIHSHTPLVGSLPTH